MGGGQEDGVRAGLAAVLTSLREGGREGGVGVWVCGVSNEEAEEVLVQNRNFVIDQEKNFDRHTHIVPQ